MTDRTLTPEQVASFHRDGYWYDKNLYLFPNMLSAMIAAELVEAG